jgi:hypothetical protein
LVAIVSNPPNCCDIDFGGPSLAFLMLATGRDLVGRDPFVDHRLHFPLSWLQLLATFLVIMILVVRVLHLLRL